MKKFTKVWMLGAVAMAAMMCGGKAMAASEVMVTFDPAKTGGGVAIPEDFAGASMEMQYVLPGKDGKYLFSPENKALIAMFKTLGIKNLRVGGNTTDNPAFAVPGDKDIDSLYAFAKEAGLEMIYTLRARNVTDPKQDVEIAKYVMDNYGSQTQCFEIGNEPNVYAKQYAQYHDLFAKFSEAITAAGEAPEAKFCGPNTTPGKAEWAKSFASDFAKGGKVVLVTQHEYPGGNQKKVLDVKAGIDKMLSADWDAGYQKAYDSFGPAAAAAGLPYRIEEANSYFNGGRQDVSNSHGASLWALDFLYWWAEHHAAGINFHTGDKVAAADESAPCWYAMFWTSPSGGGYNVHAVGYAMKAFSLSAHGTLAPVTMENADKVNLTAYAVVAADKSVYVTLINKEHGAAGRAAQVTLSGGAITFESAEMMSLEVPKNDVGATSGETLGGAPINDDATWNGKWTEAAKAGGTFTVEAGTAMIVHLKS